MQILDDILALTESVEQHVERGEWSEAGALDAERCRRLEALFADPASRSDLAAWRGVLQGLLLRNRQIIQRVQERQQELAQASVALGSARRAVHAYGRNTGPGNLVYLRPSRGNPT
ncbi:MAG: flagellar protein FliT [Gammaproteobacteria bacterium]|nr:flagellar protein FliT [Gammaproteobacteria bacterium]